MSCNRVGPKYAHLTFCAFCVAFSCCAMRLFPWLVMLCAAFAAGAINSIAGGGTLLTFPVLIWLGLDPKVANGTSTVALWPGLFGGLLVTGKNSKTVPRYCSASV